MKKNFITELAWIINALFDNKTGLKIVDKHGNELDYATLQINQTYLLDKIKSKVTEEMVEEFLQKQKEDVQES